MPQNANLDRQFPSSAMGLEQVPHETLCFPSRRYFENSQRTIQNTSSSSLNHEPSKIINGSPNGWGIMSNHGKMGEVLPLVRWTAAGNKPWVGARPLGIQGPGHNAKALGVSATPLCLAQGSGSAKHKRPKPCAQRSSTRAAKWRVPATIAFVCDDVAQGPA